MEIKLSDHFTLKRLLRFVLPSIVMMIFTSIYGVVDGFFVSNYAGKLEFTAVNLIMPFPMMLGAFGFMMGTGGSALVAISLGEGRKQEAKEYFSMFIYVTLIVGAILSAAGIIFIRPIAELLGAEGEILTHCVTYGRLLLVALATGISQLVGGVTPLMFFARENGTELKLVKTSINFKVLGKACFNGSSELMTNLSMSLVNMLYNIQLLKFAGENGVAAYGVIMYVNFIFVAVFIGYAIGTAPIIGYNYGAGNKREMQNVYKKSIGFNVVAGVVMCGLAIASAGLLSKIFVGYDPELFEMTKTGFSIYSLAFVVMGLNIYASSFFTALGNGLISALISFLRTLLFQLVAVLVLPIFFKLNGIWMAIVAAEGVALVVSLIFIGANKKKYGY